MNGKKNFALLKILFFPAQAIDVPFMIATNGLVNKNSYRI
jgi:hypothetical protein